MYPPETPMKFNCWLRASLDVHVVASSSAPFMAYALFDVLSRIQVVPFSSVVVVVLPNVSPCRIVASRFAVSFPSELLLNV